MVLIPEASLYFGITRLRLWTVPATLGVALGLSIASALAADFEDHITHVLLPTEVSTPGTVLYDVQSAPACLLQISAKDHRGDLLTLNIGLDAGPHGGMIRFGWFKVFVPPDTWAGDPVTDFSVRTFANHSSQNLSTRAVEGKHGEWRLGRKQKLESLLVAIAQGAWQYEYYSPSRKQTVAVWVAEVMPRGLRDELLSCVSRVSR